MSSDEVCTCLSISRDPLCVFHGDVDKVAAIRRATWVCTRCDKEQSRAVDYCFHCGWPRSPVPDYRTVTDPKTGRTTREVLPQTFRVRE